MVVTSTHYAYQYPQRDGQVELTWVNNMCVHFLYIILSRLWRNTKNGEVRTFAHTVPIFDIMQCLYYICPINSIRSLVYYLPCNM